MSCGSSRALRRQVGLAAQALGRVVILGCAAIALLGPAGAEDKGPAPLRQSGFHDMSAHLQALQRDRGLNPAWLWIQQGQSTWDQSCRRCHGALESQSQAAARHPRWFEPERRPRTLMQQIQACEARSALPSASPDSQVTLELAAALVAAAEGRTIQPDPAPGMNPWQERGARLWRQRMGQLNLSCAQCHDERAGQRLGGTRIPQGHDTGYPLYRMQWQDMGTLERRIRACLVGVRAEPFKPGDDDLLALMAFLHRRASGLPLEAGAVRP